MNTQTKATMRPAPGPTVTLMMVLCGTVGLVCAGTAGAGPADDVPRLTVKFDPRSLATEDGVHAVYARLVRAAEQVCPDLRTGSLLISAAAAQCRAQAVSNAVRQIDNPRLVEVFNSRAGRG